MTIARHDWDQLMNLAKVKLVGASDKGLAAEFFDLLSEFLNDTSVWTQDITVPYNNTNFVYPLFVPEGQIIRLAGIRDWGTTVPSATTLAPNGTTFVPALLGDDFASLVLKNVPNTSGYYNVTVVTNTKLPTDKHMIPAGPDWLLPVYHIALLDGLLGRMMTQTEKSYTDKTQGAYHLKRYRSAVSTARANKLRANTNGAAAWRFPQQFRSTSQQSGVPAIGSANERSF
jgi:hypothetical protein